MRASLRTRMLAAPAPALVLVLAAGASRPACRSSAPATTSSPPRSAGSGSSSAAPIRASWGRMKNERMIAQPVFDENRMYLRTYDSLLCIGRKGEEGETFEKQARIGALLDRFPFRPQRPAVAQVVTRLNWPRPRAGATLPT